MRKFIIGCSVLISMTLASNIATAGTFTLSCVHSVTGQKVSITVEASNRNEAINKARNNPEYADYDQCK